MSEFHRDHPERAFTNDDPWMQHRSFRVAAGLEGREPDDTDCTCGSSGPDRFGNYDPLTRHDCPLHGEDA